MQTNKKDEEKSSDQQAEAPNEAIQYDGTESYRLLVESVSEYAILMLDPESHIVTWNIGAQRLFGYIGSIIDITDRKLAEEALQQLNETLEARVEERTAQVRALAMYGLAINLHADHPFLIVDEDMRVLLFQIVRELLFNVIKHAGTNQATVELREEEDGQLIIGVRDAGRGFDRVVAEAQYDGGFGLFSVRARLALFSSRITISSVPGQGTHVVIYTPVFYVPQSLS